MGAYSSPCSVSTLDEAEFWLWQHSRVEDWLFGSDALPLEAQLVCDMFWLSAAQLRARLMRQHREVNPCPAPSRERRHVWGR